MADSGTHGKGLVPTLVFLLPLPVSNRYSGTPGLGDGRERRRKSGVWGEIPVPDFGGYNRPELKAPDEI